MSNMNNAQLLELVNNIKSKVVAEKYDEALQVAFAMENPDFKQYYSLQCDYCVLLVKLAYNCNIIEQFLRYSIKCFAKNHIKYLPNGYFEEWRKLLNSMCTINNMNEGSKSSMIVAPNNDSFFKINYKFERDNYFADEPIYLTLSFDNYLNVDMKDITISCTISKDNVIFQTFPIFENFTFKASDHISKRICIDNFTKNTSIAVKEISLSIDHVNFIFDQKNAKSISIEACESYCKVVVDQPPTGIVDIPIPVKIRYNSGEAYNYQLTFLPSFRDNQRDFQISASAQNKVTIDPAITIDAPNKEYEKIIYITAHTQVSTDLELMFNISYETNKGISFKRVVTISALLPFTMSTKIYSSFKTIVEKRFTTDEVYRAFAKFRYLLPWNASIQSIELHPILDANESFHISNFVTNLPIDLEKDEKFAGSYNLTFERPFTNKIIGLFDISYKIDNPDFPDVLHNSIMLPKFDVVAKDVDVKADFPLQTSQFTETEFSIEITSHSPTPLNLFLIVDESKSILIKGPNLIPISLLPGQVHEIVFKFYAVNHGLLYFPKISISENSLINDKIQRCIWESEPSLFVST